MKTPISSRRRHRSRWPLVLEANKAQRPISGYRREEEEEEAARSNSGKKGYSTEILAASREWAELVVETDAKEDVVAAFDD